MTKLFDELPTLRGERLVLKRIEHADAFALGELSGNDNVYRYLPTFLLERQYGDMHEAIDKMYGECFEQKQAIHLGVYLRGDMSFCGIVELYGYNEEMLKISMGYRLIERFWGRGIATDAVAMAVDYLYGGTNIELITASTMVENSASANVLHKNDFIMTAAGVGEDWGFPTPTPANKWFR